MERAGGAPFFGLPVKAEAYRRSHPVGCPNHDGPAVPEAADIKRNLA